MHLLMSITKKKQYKLNTRYKLNTKYKFRTMKGGKGKKPKRPKASKEDKKRLKEAKKLRRKLEKDRKDREKKNKGKDKEGENDKKDKSSSSDPSKSSKSSSSSNSSGSDSKEKKGLFAEQRAANKAKRRAIKEQKTEEATQKQLQKAISKFNAIFTRADRFERFKEEKEFMSSLRDGALKYCSEEENIINIKPKFKDMIKKKKKMFLTDTALQGKKKIALLEFCAKHVDILGGIAGVPFTLLNIFRYKKLSRKKKGKKAAVYTEKSKALSNLFSESVLKNFDKLKKDGKVPEVNQQAKVGQSQAIPLSPKDHVRAAIKAIYRDKKTKGVDAKKGPEKAKKAKGGGNKTQKGKNTKKKPEGGKKKDAGKGSKKQSSEEFNQKIPVITGEQLLGMIEKIDQAYSKKQLDRDAEANKKKSKDELKKSKNNLKTAKKDLKAAKKEAKKQSKKK